MPSKTKAVGNALYTIHAPTHDPFGNKLAIDTRQYPELDFTKLKRFVHDVHTEGPHEGHPYRHVKVLAVDSPEVDSHVKNAAAIIGQLSAHPHVFVHKDGAAGHEPWTIANPAYDGQPAHPSLIQPTAPPEAPPAATVAPASYQGNP
jgi:hypothetical protein